MYPKKLKEVKKIYNKKNRKKYSDQSFIKVKNIIFYEIYYFLYIKESILKKIFNTFDNEKTDLFIKDTKLFVKFNNCQLILNTTHICELEYLNYLIGKIL